MGERNFQLLYSISDARYELGSPYLEEDLMTEGFVLFQF
jgi:hypothetical protein